MVRIILAPDSGSGINF